MLTSVDVSSYPCIMHLYWEVQEIKVCSGLQIYILQINSRCPSSCLLAVLAMFLNNISP